MYIYVLLGHYLHLLSIYYLNMYYYMYIYVLLGHYLHLLSIYYVSDMY